MMEVKFRKFKLSDKKILTQMMLEFYKEIPSMRKIDVQTARKTMSALRGHPEKGRIFMFMWGQEVVGYAIVIYFWSNEFGGDILNVDELYIKPEFRNHGIGSTFFKYLKNIKRKNVVLIQLEVHPKNKKAKAFYEKMGFEKHEDIVLDLEL